MLKVLPAVSKVENFALKGGTAINFFWRDIPRLSVDIDLTYLPVKDRKESLQDIKRVFNVLRKQPAGSCLKPQ
jgi:predicted nucleotidyltransferase component of viral defense system